MSDPIRIGMIGVGQIGKRHVENYAKVPGANIVAVCDLDGDEAARVAEGLGGADACTDFRELLGRDDVDAVDVCLHNNLHMPVTCEALRAGKHVYCEKPMAGSYVDARTMMDAARETGNHLSIQLFTLFQPQTRAARRLIDGGMCGRLYHGRSYGYRRRNRPFVDGYGAKPFVSKATAAGGALYDMGVYHIAQVLYLMGLPEPERISGRVYQETDMDAGRRAESGFDVEELGCGFVKFRGGETLDVLESWAIHMDPFGGSLVAGSKGGVRLDPFSYFSTTCDMEMDATFDLNGAEFRLHQLNPDYAAYDSAQHHWIAALQGTVPLEPAAETALLTMLISEGMYLSDRLGREVTAEEVVETSESTAVQL